MSKQELIASVAQKAKLSKAAASKAVDSLFNGIRDSLSRGKSVGFVGFGTFLVAKRSARRGMNPRTKEPIRIPARRVPKFRAGKALKAAVRRAK
jgi:DNA-binding protein HU-beta